MLSLQSYPALCHPMGCSPPGSSVHGILQARILEWIAIPFSRGSSQSRDWTRVFCIAGRFFTTEPLGKPLSQLQVHIYFLFFGFLGKPFWLDLFKWVFSGIFCGWVYFDVEYNFLYLSFVYLTWKRAYLNFKINFNLLGFSFYYHWIINLYILNTCVLRIILFTSISSV